MKIPFQFKSRIFSDCTSLPPITRPK